MLNGKQKRYLKALGSQLDPVVQIGKAGIAPTVIESAADTLTARELIKVRILPNSPAEPEEAIAALAEAIGAELVQVIGRNGLLFKQNEEKSKIELPQEQKLVIENQKMVRGQRPEARGQRPEARGQRPEARGQRPEARGQRSEARGQRPEVRGQRPEVRGQRSEVRGSNLHKI